MANPKIERSCDRNRFTESEICDGIAETKKRQAQPGYAEREARRLREVKAKLPAAKFPDLAKRGTKPALVGMTAGEARTRHAKHILARVERNTPNI